MGDNLYLDQYAKLCGWKGTVVYFALCRYADKNRYCFPGIKLLARELGISRDSVIKGLQLLEDCRIIEIEKVRRKNGKWKNNSYILLNQTEWLISTALFRWILYIFWFSDSECQVDNSDTPSRSLEPDPGRVQHEPSRTERDPSRREQPDQVDPADSNNTNKEQNIFKKTYLTNGGEQKFLPMSESTNNPAQQDQMRDFLKSFKNRDEKYTNFVEQLCQSNRLSKEVVEEQIKKFVLHWIEPGQDGTKMRWELEKNFIFKLRLTSWFLQYQRNKKS